MILKFETIWTSGRKHHLTHPLTQTLLLYPQQEAFPFLIWQNFMPDGFSDDDLYLSGKISNTQW